MPAGRSLPRRFAGVTQVAAIRCLDRARLSLPSCTAVRSLADDVIERPEAAMSRTVRAPRGTELSCKGWGQEAALRMLMNNLDPEVAERPEDLVVYGGTGKAARNWDCYDAIVRSLRCRFSSNCFAPSDLRRLRARRMFAS